MKRNIRLPNLPAPADIERELDRTLARADELKAMLRVARRQARRRALDAASATGMAEKGAADANR